MTETWYMLREDDYIALSAQIEAALEAAQAADSTAGDGPVRAENFARLRTQVGRVLEEWPVATVELPVTRRDSPLKSKSMCAGCRNDFYNHHPDMAPTGCWSYAVADVVRKGIALSLADTQLVERITLSCYQPEYH